MYVQEPIRHGIRTLLRRDSGSLIQEQGWRVSGANGQVGILGFNLRQKLCKIAPDQTYIGSAHLF